MNMRMSIWALLRGVALTACVSVLSFPALAAGAARSSPPAGADASQSLPPVPGMPANVRAILQKMSQGEQVSPADQKLVEDWERSAMKKYQHAAQAGGQAAPGGGNGAGLTKFQQRWIQQHSQSSSGRAKGKAPASGVLDFESSAFPQSPCVPVGHAVGLDVTPSRAVYVAMARGAMQTYGRLLSSDARSKLTQALSHQKPTAGSDLAPLLMVTGETDAAIFSAAYAAVHAPTDALTANNLGAMLRAPPDYARSAVALKYAASLAPKSPLVATNLGWLALSQGDRAAAGPYLKAAVAEDPHMAGALAAQGVIQMCSGHASKALPLFRASMAAGYSKLAANGIDAAMDAAPQPAHGAQPDMGSPDVYGTKSSLAPPTWPAPPIPNSALTISAYFPHVYVQYQNMIAKADTQNQAAINVAYAAEDNEPQTRYDGNAIVFDRGYDKEIFVLSDLRTILEGELDRPMHALAAQVNEFVHKGGTCLTCGSGGNGPVPHPSCSFQRAVIAYYPHYAALFKLQDWPELVKALNDLYAFSAPWIARIHDPAIAAAEKAKLDNFAMTYALNFSQYMGRVAAEANAKWTYGCPGEPVAASPKPQKIKPYPINPLKCQMKPMVFPMKFASMTGDCDKMTLTLGIGQFAVGGEYKFAPDYTFENGTYVYTGGDDGQWTVSAGSKMSGMAGLSVVSAGAGGYVTFQGGHVTDIGEQNQVSLFGIPAFTHRISVMAGPSHEPSGADWTHSGGQ